jgi:hypothetical protein
MRAGEIVAADPPQGGSRAFSSIGRSSGSKRIAPSVPPSCGAKAARIEQAQRAAR